MPPAGNWLRFAGSISPLFVLSHSMPMINTTSKLASFWRFSVTAGSLPSDSLATLLSPHAPRSPPHAPPAGSGRARTLPAGYCHPPTAELRKTERGPISRSSPSIFTMSPSQAIAAEKSIRFSPLAVARPSTIRSRPETLNASGSRRACRMAISRNACALPDFPAVAQAVRYGVTGTPEFAQAVRYGIIGTRARSFSRLTVEGIPYRRFSQTWGWDLWSQVIQICWPVRKTR